MEEYKHLGAYAIIIKNDQILLIKKYGGPYDKKLDLPGGTIEFNERPADTLKRELLEEVGINITDYKLFDCDSVSFNWQHKNKLFKVHHIGIFYQVLSYENEIKENIEIDAINDDSLGASFYNISKLKKENLSNPALLELTKLGYKIKEWVILWIQKNI